MFKKWFSILNFCRDCEKTVKEQHEQKEKVQLNCYVR